MKRFLITGGVLALILSPMSPAAGQEMRRQGPGGPGGPMAMNPVAFLLEQGDSLTLTDTQRTRLTVVKDSLDASNAPHIAELRRTREAGGGGTGRMQALRPMMEKVRMNNDAWLAKALTALEPEQREIAERLLDRRRPRGPGGGR